MEVLTAQSDSALLKRWVRVWLQIENTSCSIWPTWTIWVPVFHTGPWIGSISNSALSLSGRRNGLRWQTAAVFPWEVLSFGVHGRAQINWDVLKQGGAGPWKTAHSVWFVASSLVELGLMLTLIFANLTAEVQCWVNEPAGLDPSNSNAAHEPNRLFCLTHTFSASTIVPIKKQLPRSGAEPGPFIKLRLKMLWECTDKSTGVEG